MVVPLNMWVLISNFKLAYNLLRRPDGTFNRDLAEFLDRKVPANANPMDGVFSFDVIVDRETNLLTRIYRPAEGEERPVSILELEKPVSSEVVSVIIFFHGGGRGAETGSFWVVVEDEVRMKETPYKRMVRLSTLI
ncbi:hypothetical protein LR48_Vigan05g057200 [Vigna angularis]|uniref:Alpha/beta hydrolase fold-3 domain-containing protein n=1 Tax=Phaseolus angularis TaxID=3914 RepID=A0A0L9UJP7_PHAAN|nr:hypothetical protein LR48_Vigan05g057200 [Vigna angularis]